MTKYLNRKNLYILTVILVVLHPIIELDYLAYPMLHPRITTVVNLILYPLIVLGTFFLFEKKKLRVLLCLLAYGAVFGAYYLIHCRQADALQYTLYLPPIYYFSFVDETVYCFTLLLPLVYVWVFYRQEIREDTLEKASFCLSGLISVPIFLGNLFTFGMSTYEGYTIRNIFSWFSLPFDAEKNHPRLYASKFFFEEGNTISIILFAVLPILYYFFYKAEDRKKKILYGVLIFIQSMAMMMLSTRIATYGAIIVPVAMLGIYVFLMFLRKESFSKVFTAFLVGLIIVTAGILPFSPAYQNQQIDARSYEFQKGDDGKKDEARKGREAGKDLEKYSPEWFGFYTHYFEDYRWLIRVTPPAYYRDMYDYKFDPQFWVDLIFDYELEERINGRQIQTIFTKYKWKELSSKEELFGMGYSTFMHGGIIIERDFVRQYYAFGPVGCVLLMGWWVLLAAYLGLKILLGYKKGSWNYLNITLMMSICMIFASSYVSGHTFDQLSSSILLSLFSAVLLLRLRKEYAHE